MPKFQQGDEQISDGVNLLISILVRYPEVGSISYNPSNQSIKLTFFLAGSSDKAASLTSYIRCSLDAYHMLKAERNAAVTIQMNKDEAMEVLTIIRDVRSLSRGEIALIIALLRDKLLDLPVTDQSESLVEEDMLIQEELIENMLDNLKKEYDSHSLIGIREDGRVLVFNK